MEISLLQHSRDRRPQTTALDDVVQLIRADDHLRQLTEACRSGQAGKPEANLPWMVANGIVEGGVRQSDIVRMTGLAALLLTIDDGEVDGAFAEARDDPHTLLCFRDADGRSLNILFTYEPEPGDDLQQQKRFCQRAFDCAADYYSQLLHASARRTDRGRTCQLAHDADAHYSSLADAFLVCDINEAARARRQGRKARLPPKAGHKACWNEHIASVAEMEQYLADHLALRFNVVTHRVECRLWAQQSGEHHPWKPISDRVENTLWRDMEQTLGKEVRFQNMCRLIESDHAPDYHPMREYIRSLPPWDGDNHILVMSTSVLVKGGTDEQLLFAHYLRKWLVGMVAAWMDDDVVNNVILILVGPQGIYKTTWFNYLLPPQLRSYFYTKGNAQRMTKDDLLTLSQYALVCCEELDTMRPAELNQLKAAVTMTHINERAAYARHHESRPHLATFCGTGNNVQFLNDATGNRRWLPFEVESITSPRDEPFDYDAIYAEAYALYRQGFEYWFNQAEIERLARHNETFEVPRLETELVQQYFRKPQGAEPGEFMPVSVAMQIVGSTITQKLSSVMLGRAFMELDFERKVSHNVRGYLVVRRTPEEMKVLRKQMAIAANTDTDNTDVF